MNDTADIEVVEPVAQTQSMVAMIERVALNPDVDPDKMMRLLDVQERVLNRQAEQAFNQAMVACRNDMPVILVDKKNNQTNSKYATMETINKQIVPIYTQHGFTMSFGRTKPIVEGNVAVVCDVSHVAGHTRRYDYELPIDTVGIQGNRNKTDVHGTASTDTYCRRRLTQMIWNLTIAGEDDDGNKAGGDNRSAMEVAQDHIDYMSLVRELWPSIAALKAAIAEKDYQSAIEAWDEVSNAEKKRLWRAPSKGGILATAERAAMRSEEWHAERKAMYGDQTARLPEESQ